MGAILLLGGLFIGYILGVCGCIMSKYAGTLRIDSTNPDKDIFRIDITNIDDIYKEKYIVLKIDVKADLSQK